MEAVKKGMQHNLLLETGIQMHSTNYWREMNRYPSRFVQKLLVQFHSTQSSRGTSFFSFIFITGVRTLMWSLEMPSLCLWSVIPEATAFSPILISESRCWCESTPFPMRWWLMRSRPVQCIPNSMIPSVAFKSWVDLHWTRCALCSCRSDQS
ncbi:hypothetical protein BLSTO_05488 [Blastocystis sp. subtype 1]